MSSACSRNALASFPLTELRRTDELAFRHRVPRTSLLRLGAALVAELPEPELRRRLADFPDRRRARHNGRSATG
jgi:hypothetical protein